MGSQENIRLVQDLMQAARSRDTRKYGEFFADDAVIRVAGVPHALGGVTRGRDQIIANFAADSTSRPGRDALDLCGEGHACAIVKVSNNFAGTQYFRGRASPIRLTNALSTTLRMAGSRVRPST
jgi:ketosteroid isomerase-like protein